jgi:two-component system KDP operon response regulator KdpE
MTVCLLVAANDAAGRRMAEHLTAEGFAVTGTESLADLVRRLLTTRPDAVLALTADVAAAREHCELVRAVDDVPLVVAVPALSPEDAVTCLDLGADAALALPLAPAELAARLRAVLRRDDTQTPPAPVRIRIGDLEIDRGLRQVARQGRRVRLTPTEFRLLEVLAEEPGRVVPTRELLTRVWGEAYVDDLQYVRVYIGYLRAKLGDDPRAPSLIRTQWGVGYRLAVPDPGPSAGPRVPGGPPARQGHRPAHTSDQLRARAWRRSPVPGRARRRPPARLPLHQRDGPA